MIAFLSLFRFWRAWLLVGVFAAIVGGGGYVWYDISHLKSELAVSQANVTALTVANTAQKSALAECSANTEQLKADADAWAKKAAAAEFAAQAAAKVHYDSAKQILTVKPTPGASDYQAADDLLNSLIPALGR